MEKGFQELDEIFHPKSVAVIGASSNLLSAGYAYMTHLLNHFAGKIFPVNPNLKEVFGSKVYLSLRDIPEPVDYIICCISAEKVLGLLDDCPAKNVKLIHLFTARMSETGREERIKLEREILEKAKSFGIRVLGPNCMGIYCPKAGLSYGYDFPMESGPVGAIFQSGGASTDFVHYGALRGLRFSKVISYGNALDIDESELLHYLAQDPETEVVALYVEGVKDGRRFVDALSSTAQRKPVVVLKGGRGRIGARSIRSHTASLTGQMEIWRTVFRRCNAVEVFNFQELLDQVAAFSFLPPITGKKVVVAGGGGGKSVFSADLWEEEGFELPDLPLEMRKKLREKAPDIWDWLRNPIDLSILQDTPMLPEELLQMFDESEKIDFFILNMTEDDPLPVDVWRAWADEHMDEAMRLAKEGKPVVVIIQVAEVSPAEMNRWRWGQIGEIRKRIIEARVPVFPSPDRAAKALRRLIDYWKRRVTPLHSTEPGCGIDPEWHRCIA